MTTADARQRIRTARRSGAAARISLAQRRRWFADDPNPAGETSDGTQNTGDTTQHEDRIPYARFKEVNDARLAAERERDQLKAADEQRKLAKQQEDGQLQDVINTLKPKAERTEVLEQTLKEYLDAEIAEIPESMRDLVPEGDTASQLKWIKSAKAKNFFKKPQAPDLDGGKQGDTAAKAVKVSDTQKQMAALAAQHGFSVKAEDLAKRQQEIEAARKRKPETKED